MNTLSRQERKALALPKIIALAKKGKTHRQISDEVGIPLSTVGKWLLNEGVARYASSSKNVKVKTAKKVPMPKIDISNIKAGEMTNAEFKAVIDEFIRTNGSEMTNAEMTDRLMELYPDEYAKYANADRPQMAVAGRVSRAKQLGIISGSFLLDDRQKSKSKAQKRKERKDARLVAYFKENANVVMLIQHRIPYVKIQEFCNVSYTKIMTVKNKMIENRHLFQAYKNGDSEAKDNCRSIVIDHVVISENVGTFLTLPSSNVTFERRVIDEVSQYMTFDAVEYDNKVFMEMVSQFATLSILDRVRSFQNCPVGEVVERARANEYAHAFLDYCGTFSKYESDVRTAMQNKIVERNGILAFTFCLAHDYGNKLENLVNHIQTSEEQSFTYSAVESYFKENIGTTYVMKEMHKYISDNNTPMVLVVLKRKF